MSFKVGRYIKLRLTSVTLTRFNYEIIQRSAVY